MIIVTSIIDETLRKRRSKIRPNDVLYVTDLTKSCLRKAYLDIKNPQKYPIETLRIFEAGNILEDYWIKILEEDSDHTVLSSQLPARYYGKGFSVHGRIDIITQTKNGSLMVREVKTIKSFRYLNEPKSDHVNQIQFYMNVLGIELGQIDYIDKTSLLSGGTSGMGIDRSFTIVRNPVVFRDLLLRASSLHTALCENVLPESTKGWLCDYCPHPKPCSEHHDLYIEAG
jgi:hypothetical protein